MIDYLVKEPEINPNNNTLDKKENKKLFKYPFIASEIFTADIDYLIKAFFEDEPSVDEEEGNKQSRKNS